MENTKGLQKQVARLRSLPRKEDSQPWAALGPEYERVLRAECETDAQCETVVDYVIDSAQGENRFSPNPADFRQLAKQVGVKVQLFPDPECAFCFEGWVVVEKNGNSGVTKCVCWARRKPAEGYFVEDPQSGGTTEAGAGRSMQLQPVSSITSLPTSTPKMTQ